MSKRAPYADRRVADSARQSAMCDLYRSGKTLQEIGDMFAVSRERARQIIAAAGMTRSDGGMAITAASNAKKKARAAADRRDARTLLYYGCPHAEMLRLNGGTPARVASSAAGKFRQQKNNALARHVSWTITFPQWMAIWLDSGHWDERGRTRNGYVMARKGDTGGYAAGNVYITTLAGNVSDYQATLRRRGVKCADGFRRLPEKSSRFSPSGEKRSALGSGRGWTLLKKSKKNPYQVVACNRYVGLFPTQAVAEAAYEAATNEAKKKAA